MRNANRDLYYASSRNTNHNRARTSERSANQNRASTRSTNRSRVDSSTHRATGTTRNNSTRSASQRRSSQRYGSNRQSTMRAYEASASTTASRKPFVIVIAAAIVLALAIVGCNALNHKTSSNEKPVESLMSTITASQPRMLTFLAVGDIVPHKEMIAQSRSDDGSYDFNHVFEPVLTRNHVWAAIRFSERLSKWAMQLTTPASTS